MDIQVTQEAQGSTPDRPKRLRFKKPWIICDSHKKDCTCSYCQSKKVGIVLPECKAHNAWRSIRWYWGGKLQVIRWTMPNISYQ